MPTSLPSLWRQQPFQIHVHDVSVSKKFAMIPRSIYKFSRLSLGMFRVAISSVR